MDRQALHAQTASHKLLEATARMFGITLTGNELADTYTVLAAVDFVNDSDTSPWTQPEWACSA